MTITEYKHELRLLDLKYDPWGTTMAAWFDVAAELWTRGETPLEWDYSPGVASDPREPENHFFNMFKAENTGTLILLGNLLERYTRQLTRAGKDY